MTAPKRDAALVNYRISALTLSERGPLLNTKKSRLGGAAEYRKHGGVLREIERVVPPIPLCHSSSVTLQQLVQLESREGHGRWIRVSDGKQRSHDARGPLPPL